MLRHTGYTGPVELWHRESDRPELPDSLGISYHVIPGAGRKFRWTDRTTALLETKAKFVFHLDSDCYPVADITPCFDDVRESGCVAWQDCVWGDAFFPVVYGLSPGTAYSTYTPQCGSLLLDMEKQRGVVSRVHEYCKDPSMFRYNPSWDQPHWRAAWVHEGITPQRYSPNRVTVLHGGRVFLHQGRDGETPLLVHRTGAKFGITDLMLPDVPEETTAWGFYDEYRRVFEKSGT